MHEHEMEKLVKEMVSRWESIPRFYRRDQTVKRTLQCFLFASFSERGALVVADYFPPRVSDRAVDLVVIDREDPKKISLALCIDDLVTLQAVKSLSAFDARKKVIFTIHPLEKKVKESMFFLKPGIEHYHLHGPQTGPFA